MDEYQQQPQKSWWGRNWKWVVPVGCLTPVVLVIGCAVAAFFAISGIIKSSDVYLHSVAAVASNEAVNQALGEPIQPGLQFQGEINVSNGGGHADITYNISGPKGDATVHVVADRHEGVWTYQTHKVHITATNQDIDVPMEANAPAK